MIKKRTTTQLGTILFSVVALSACGGGSSSSDSDQPAGGGTVAPSTIDMGTNDTGTTETDTGTIETDTGTTDTGTIIADMTAPTMGLVDMGEGSTPDPVENINIATAIRGAWASNCEVLASGDLSARQIFVFNESELIRDWYEYDGEQCAGVPRGQRFPLLVDDYALGSDVVTSGSMSALEINLTLKQLPETEFDLGLGEFSPIGLEVGGERHTLVSFMDGKVLWQDQETTDAANRATELDNVIELTAHQPITSPDITPESILGVYRTACLEPEPNTYSYTFTIMEENMERTQDHFFFNHLCLGEPAAIVEIPTTIEYAAGVEAFQNDFGDTLLPMVRTRDDQFIVSGAEVISFELLGPREPRFSAYALAGDTLMLSDCIIRVSECKTSAEFPTDHVDYEFQSDKRNAQIDSTEPAPGNSDTSLIAGFWDGSFDIDEGGRDVFLYQYSANGLATYYDYENDPNGSGEDCYYVYTETITHFDNNEYLYEGIRNDGSTYSFAETAELIDGELVFTAASGEIVIAPEFAGDVSSLNECT